MLILNLYCQLVLRISAVGPLYLKKAGLAIRNIVHRQKTFYVVSVSAFIFFILLIGTGLWGVGWKCHFSPAYDL